jgi:hypothetical protein
VYNEFIADKQHTHMNSTMCVQSAAVAAAASPAVSVPHTQPRTRGPPCCLLRHVGPLPMSGASCAQLRESDVVCEVPGPHRQVCDR